MEHCCVGQSYLCYAGAAMREVQLKRNLPVKAEPVDRPAPSEAERAAIKRAAGRLLDRGTRFAVTVEEEGGKLTVGCPHADAEGGQFRLLDTFGTSSLDFANGALNQIATTMRDGGKVLPSEGAINAALAAVDGIAPQNEVEAMLAVQMAATHNLAMTLLSRTKQADTLNLVAVYGPLSVKLLRAFSGQVEALDGLRRGGGQTVRVEHVHVHSGGQAIVGHIETGGRIHSNIE